MLPALAALIALQELDTAAEAARRRIAEMPAREAALADAIATAEATREAAAARMAGNQDTRRELEKQVAAVDSRLSRFEDHKAAVKTNQEFTALLHEIETAKAEKDGVEDRILEALEEADAIAEAVAAAERAVSDAKAVAAEGQKALARERQAVDEELARLEQARAVEIRHVEPTLLARYDQLLKQRKGIAVAAMEGEICAACYVRQRPHAAQQVRRNDEIMACESCQRILYAPPPASVEGAVNA